MNSSQETVDRQFDTEVCKSINGYSIGLKSLRNFLIEFSSDSCR